jgi:hypothetical protein
MTVDIIINDPPEGWKSRTKRVIRLYYILSLFGFFIGLIATIGALIIRPSGSDVVKFEIYIVFWLCWGFFFGIAYLRTRYRKDDTWDFFLPYNHELYHLLEKEIETMVSTKKYDIIKSTETNGFTASNKKDGMVYNHTYHIKFFNVPDIIFSFSLEIYSTRAGRESYGLPLRIYKIHVENLPCATQFIRDIMTILVSINYQNFKQVVN